MSSGARVSLLLPGTHLTCRFDAPSIGSFKADLVVRSVDDDPGDDSSGPVRVAAEFLLQDKHARQVIASCITRPMSANSLADLNTENLLYEDWIELVEFSAIREDTVEEAVRIVGRLSDETACVYNLVVGPGQELGQACFVNPVLDERQLLARAQLEVSAMKNLPSASRAMGIQTSPRELPAKKPQQNFLRRLLRRENSRRTASTVRWDEYARAYDVMCISNPAYQNNLALFRSWLDSIELTSKSTVCDVGAGTGNYTLELARRFPSTRVIHLDSDPVMNRTASRKYRNLAAENVEFRVSNVLGAGFAPQSLDLIVCVNALYTFTGTLSVLEQFRSWLKPSGVLFLLDLGRPMNVADWSKYIIGASLKERGVRATVASFVKGRKAIGQNRLIRREQERGNYWLHSSEEFKTTVSSVGFEITSFQTCYRDVCDLAVCRRVSNSADSGDF